MRPTECLWAGHLMIHWRSMWGDRKCLRCGVFERQVISGVREYVTVRPV